MSYLQRPRLHFFGNFETDVSTVNNITTSYDPATFQNQDQTRTSDKTLGSWNPYGTGSFRLFKCRVRSAFGKGEPDARDPVLAMELADAAERVPAKLVDLDPDQQMVSQIWGMRLRLVTADGHTALSGHYKVAAFTDVWKRVQNPPGRPDSTMMSVFYQSRLTDVRWDERHADSPFLRELHDAAGCGSLSMRFVMDHFNDDFTTDGFRLGRLCGSLGVAHEGEPKHFVRGRQLFSAAMAKPGFPFSPAATFGNAVAILDTSDSSAPKAIVDLSNALPTKFPTFELIPMKLQLGTGTPPDFAPLGVIECNTAWYEETGGVVEFPLTGEDLARLQETPLAIVDAGADPIAIVATEEPKGEHVRADDFVFRLSPGKPQSVTLYATVFGRKLPNATIHLVFDNKSFDNTGDPPAGDPPEALKSNGEKPFPADIPTNEDGIGTLELIPGPPGNRRVYIDGQIYGVRPKLPRQVAGDAPVNPSDFISVLVFDDIKIPDEPTWYVHVRPILRPYANLYPVMRQVLDLDDYESVVAHKEMLLLAFSLDPEDPNYMPVTRDLSPKKLALLKKWLSTPGEPLLGHEPPLGNVPPPVPKISAPPAPAAAPVAGTRLAHDGSKAEFLSRTERFGDKG